LLSNVSLIFYSKILKNILGRFLTKKAVVLLITLGFITVITVLIMQTVTLSKSSLDDLTKVKIQNQLMFYMINVTNLLKEQKADDIRDYFLDQEIPVFDEKSGVNLTVKCQALDDKLNLNKLLSCNNARCDEIIKRYAKDKELVDEDYFLALLKDTVAPLKAAVERRTGSRIIIDDKTFSDGCILNYKTIKQIQDKYYQELRDPNIYKIKKDDFLDIFYLSDLKLKEDGNDSKPNGAVSKVLGCYENNDACQKEFKNINKSLNNITNCSTNKNNKSIKTKDLIQCKVDLYINDEIHSIIFKYNLNQKVKKRVVSIDEFF
jgi:hypothetical protein